MIKCVLFSCVKGWLHIAMYTIHLSGYYYIPYQYPTIRCYASRNNRAVAAKVYLTKLWWL